MGQSFVVYDGLSKDPFSCAVYLTVEIRGKHEAENFVRGSKGWVVVPKPEGA